MTFGVDSVTREGQRVLRVRRSVTNETGGTDMRTVGHSMSSTRESAESVMREHIAKRAELEIKIQAKIDRAAQRPKSKWKSTLAKNTDAIKWKSGRETVNLSAEPLTPKEIIAKHGDMVTFEEIEETPEDVAPVEAAPEPNLPGEYTLSQVQRDADTSMLAQTVWATKHADAGMPKWAWMAMPGKGQRAEFAYGEALLTVLPANYFPAPVEVEEQPEPVVEFPAELLAGESVEPYAGEHHRTDDDGYDWVLTLASGDEYRLFSRGYERGRWQVVRGVHDSTFWWAELDEDNSLTAAVAWCRADSASAAWAQDVWARFGHMNEERVTWSAELVQTELEPRVFRVERYGRVGIMAKYTWGWEHRPNGWSAEAGTSGAVDGMFRKRAAHKLTVAGLREVPLDRWVITRTDGVREQYGVHGKTALECGPGSWDEAGLCIGACWNKNAPARFVVDILAEDGAVMGTVGVCALHLARPLAKASGHDGNVWETAYELCGKTSGAMGSRLDWEERYCDIVAEMVTAALEAGESNPRPDVVAALYAEADAIRAQQEAKAAKTAQKNTSTGGESSTMGRRGMAPRAKAATVKVGDIVFTGDQKRGHEWAELRGHTYRAVLLDGLYSVTHMASGVEVVRGEKSRAAMKRAILADALPWADAEPVDPRLEWAMPKPEAKPVTHADLMAVDGEELVALLDCLSEEQREDLAAPWPVRWLYPEKQGDRPRGLNFCAGCGGGCKGKRLVTDSDMVCVDLEKGPVATSRAAGCTVVQADVRTLTPEHPALRWTRDAMFTMPCPDYSIAGNGAGRTAQSLEILTEAIAQVGFAFGNYEKDGTEYCDHEEEGEECSEEEGCFSSYGSRTDFTVPEMWALVDGMDGKTAGLMLAPVIWCLGLRYIGAPLTRVVIEQAAQLPEEIQEDIWLELSVAGCESASWDVLDAADFGSPSHRRRSIMAAHWYRMAALPEAPGITTLAYQAIGWEADAEVNTRGNRQTSGGNVFRMDGVTRRHPDPKPINGITSKIRGWYEATTGRRFTIAEVCLLVGLPADFPVVGSRSSQCQQLGDVFSSLVSLAVWGELTGAAWRETLGVYLGELYPSMHGADAAEISEPIEQTPAGDQGQEIPVADSEEKYTPRPRAHRWEIRRAKEVLTAAGFNDHDQDSTTGSGFVVINDMHAVAVVPVLNSDHRRPRKLTDRKLWDEMLGEFAEALRDAGFRQVGINPHRVRGFAPVPSEPQTVARVRDVNDWVASPSGYRLRSVTFDGHAGIECRIGFHTAGAGASSFHLQDHEQNQVPAQAGESLTESVERLCDWYGLAEPFQILFEEVAGEQGEEFPVADEHEHTGTLARYVSFPGKKHRVESRLTVECECGHVVWKRSCNGAYDQQFVPMYLEAEGYGAGPWEQYEGADLGEFGMAEDSTAQLVRVEVFKGDVLRRMRKIKPLPGLLGQAPDHAPCGECGSVITKSPYWLGQDWTLGAWCGWCARLPLDTDFEGLRDTAAAVDTKRGFCLVPLREEQPANGEEISGQVQELAGEPVEESPVADTEKKSVMAELLEQHYGPDWRGGCTFEDVDRSLYGEDDQEEEQAAVQGLAPISEQQRKAAWRMAAGESLNTPAGESVQEIPRADIEPVAPVLPSTGRGYWNTGDRVLHQGRAGRVVSATIGKTLVELDGAEPGHLEHVDPRALVAERYVVCGTPVTLTVPRRAAAEEEVFLTWSEILEAYEVPEVPALVVCTVLDMPTVPKRVADPRTAWMMPKPEPVDPRTAWATYEVTPEPVDVLAALRAELEELRADIDTWGGVAAATAVANAETIVRELASELRLLEVEALRREARELREELGWGPVRWAAIETPRGRRWAMAASVAGTVAGLGAALGTVVPPRV
ncbi:hypothetical protein [Streptomyces sp. AP-93]|uniref:hypothetical protein n=1 Tax=Streptomyces sp. AP-93 TaxID=2929048 RepID=UPI001FAF8F73|nr:hypothetical protein [Streptomyces sp. AP-93]